ncbi:MAG: GNAT family N-acetyltransferase [Alphaproteobacteria bacterium]|nr:GNAT family N-acetyltransferase [Alphaproteobacteria bacterium]
MRQVTEQDFDTIYDIYMDEGVNYAMLHELCSKDDFKEIFAVLMTKDEFLIFEQDGEAYGMCAISKGVGRLSHAASLSSVAVKKDFQGRGLGKIMMQDVVEHLTDQGFLRIEALAIIGNDPAVELYKSIGFEAEDCHKKFFKRAGDTHYENGVLLTHLSF